MIDTQVLQSIVTTLGGIAIAYLAYRGRIAYVKKTQRSEPKDRMEQMFDGYERLIKQKDIEDERKSRIITRLEAQVTELDERLANTRELLVVTRNELAESKTENTNLRGTLDVMRDEYRRVKNSVNKTSEA